MPTRTLMTAEEFDALEQDESQRLELMDGEVMELSSASPEHNEIKVLLSTELVIYFRRTHLGMVLPETDFVIGEERRFRPDLAIVLAAKRATMDRHRVPVAVPPDVAIEVTSPSESAWDVDRKTQAYLQAGVAEVWVIYPAGQHMFIYSATGVRQLRSGDLLESPLLPGWSMPVADLFTVL